MSVSLLPYSSVTTKREWANPISDNWKKYIYAVKCCVMSLCIATWKWNCEREKQNFNVFWEKIVLQEILLRTFNSSRFRTLSDSVMEINETLSCRNCWDERHFSHNKESQKSIPHGALPSTGSYIDHICVSARERVYMWKIAYAAGCAWVYMYVYKYIQYIHFGVTVR